MRLHGVWAGDYRTERGTANAFDEHAPSSQFFRLTEIADERSVGGYVNSSLPATSAYPTVRWVDLR